MRPLGLKRVHCSIGDVCKVTRNSLCAQLPTQCPAMGPTPKSTFGLASSSSLVWKSWFEQVEGGVLLGVNGTLSHKRHTTIRAPLALSASHLSAISLICRLALFTARFVQDTRACFLSSPHTYIPRECSGSSPFRTHCRARR